MLRISKDSPVYYLTSVPTKRLPVFRTERLKEKMCDALGEARTSAGLLLFAYVIMPKLRHSTGPREHRYSLWDHQPNVKLITTENALMEKANYIHMNPVRAGLVERPEDYRWSSVRCWQGKPLDDEPLLMDLDQIAWHK